MEREGRRVKSVKVSRLWTDGWMENGTGTCGRTANAFICEGMSGARAADAVLCIAADR